VRAEECLAMQVEINKQDSIQLPSMGHVIFGTDESCDYIFDIKDNPNIKLISIIQDKAACIVEVFNDQDLYVNNHLIKEMAILHPGDVLKINQQTLKIINDNKLPRVCNAPFKLNKNTNTDELLITSVSGLRSFNEANNGELTIVGNQNSFTHKPLSDGDIPFSVSFIDDSLTLLCKKDKEIEINGNKANYVTLKNGDYISSGKAKYCVESPGTSSFSKYSPSHPRNIQLSEEYLVDNNYESESKSNFFKANLWWIALIGGITIIAGILFILKNMS